MKDLLKNIKTTAIAIAVLALPFVANSASVVSLNTQTFTNVPTHVHAGAVSNFISNPVQLPVDKAVSIWLTMQGSSIGVGETNDYVTNATVTFALGWDTATNSFVTANLAPAMASTIAFASAYHSATNWSVAWTNFSAATLAGAKYIRPISIEYPSDATAHVLTNISLRWSYVQ